jgi:hypothetical protein
MTAHFALTSAFVVFVSIFGLSSCSKDNPDSWDISEPVISTAGQRDVAIRAADLQNLPGTSELKLTTSDGSVSVVNVVSSCRFNEKTISHGLRLTTNRILLRDLWPNEFWKTLSPEELKTSSCDFDFNVSGENGSTHEFKLETVRVTDFTVSTASNSNSTPKNELNLSTAKQNESVLALLPSDTTPVGALELSMICETFSNILNLKDFSGKRDGIVETLINGPLPLDAGVDPRVKKSVQDCRFLKNDSSQTPIHHVLTKSFALAFPPPALAITQSSQLRSATNNLWPRLSVFAIQLKNTTTAKTAVRLPKDFGALRVRLLGYATPALHPQQTTPGDFFESPQLLTETLEINITGSAARIGDGAYWIYEIAPGATLNVNANIHTNRTCWLQDAPEAIEKTSWAGLMFGFTTAIKFEQFQDWNSAQDPKSSVVDLHIVPEAQNPTEEPTAFAPSEGFLSSIDQHGQLPSNRVRLAPVARSNGISVDLCW